MGFWDASAIVPLVLDEPRSGAMVALLGEETAMSAWWGTRIECVSALRRRERDGELGADAVAEAAASLARLAAAWTEVLPTERVRARAERALAVHDLRAADALQLAAALTWAGESTAQTRFACLDERLASAAAREGFDVVAGPRA